MVLLSVEAIAEKDEQSFSDHDLIYVIYHFSKNSGLDIPVIKLVLFAGASALNFVSLCRITFSACFLQDC